MNQENIATSEFWSCLPTFPQNHLSCQDRCSFNELFGSCLLEHPKITWINQHPAESHSPAEASNEECCEKLQVGSEENASPFNKFTKDTSIELSNPFSPNIENSPQRSSLRNGLLSPKKADIDNKDSKVLSMSPGSQAKKLGSNKASAFKKFESPVAEKHSFSYDLQVGSLIDCSNFEGVEAHNCARSEPSDKLDTSSELSSAFKKITSLASPKKQGSAKESTSPSQMNRFKTRMDVVCKTR